MDIAYELRPELAEEYLGGLIAVDDDRDFDPKRELDAGEGVIVVDDSDASLITALDGAAALRRTKVPADRVGDAEPRSEVIYGREPVAELKNDAKNRGLTGYSGSSRDELEVALSRHDELLATVEDDPEVIIPTTIEGLVADASGATAEPATAEAAASADSPADAGTEA